MNIVPNPQTRAAAASMVKTAQQTSGPDAVLRHLAGVEPAQWPALVGILLNTATLRMKKTGRPRYPLSLSEDDRRRGYSQYRQGIRNEFTVTAYREYQRVNQQRRRDEARDPDRAVRSVAS